MKRVPDSRFTCLSRMIEMVEASYSGTVQKMSMIAGLTAEKDLVFKLAHCDDIT